LKKEPGDRGDHSAEEASEYWPFLIFGTRLKITDSLLALFTFWLVVIGAWQGYQIKKLSIWRALNLFPLTGPQNTTSAALPQSENSLPNTRTNLIIEAANIGDSKATITEIGFDIYIEGQQFNARAAALSKFRSRARLAWKPE